MANDSFGISMLNPTKAGGRTWFSNWHTAPNHTWSSTAISVRNADPYDSTADLHCRGDQGNKATTTQSTGILKAEGENWRLYINDPDGILKWQNVEMTVYYRQLSQSGGGISVHARLAARSEHQLEFQCAGSGHTAGAFEIKGNGTIQLRKEMLHVSGAGAYAANVISDTSGAPSNTWIGMKLIVKNVGTTTLVQGYRDVTDGANGGTWSKVLEKVDGGNWEFGSQSEIDAYNGAGSGSGLCTKITPRTARLPDPASSCYLRMDGNVVEYKKFSIREIATDNVTPGTPATPSSTYTYEFKWGTNGSGDGQFLNPHDIAFDATGANLWVCDRDRNDVQKFTSAGVFVSKFGSSGSGNGQYNVPYAMDINPAFTHLYICDRGNDRVQKVTLTGTWVSNITNSGGKNLNAPEDICFNPANGDIFICDTGNNRIIKLDSNHNFITQWDGSDGDGTKFDHPHSMDITAEGDILVSCGNDPFTQKFTNNGTYIKRWGTEGNGQGQVRMFLEHGDVDIFQRWHLINNDVRPIINVWTTNGDWITQYGATTSGNANGQFNEPEHVTCHPVTGKPYVVDANNQRIQVFSVGTGPSQPPGSPGSGPSTPGGTSKIDKFGHSLFYPLKSGGYEYYMSDNPKNDQAVDWPSEMSFPSSGVARMSPDGPTDFGVGRNNREFSGKNAIGGCGMDFEAAAARGYIYKANDVRDIEMKARCKFSGSGWGDNGFSLGVCTGRHSSDGCCQGFAYMCTVEITESPSTFRFRKEMWHVSYHTSPEGNQTHSKLNFKILGAGRYVGLGLCRYNKKVAGKESPADDDVVLEFWFNPDPDSNPKDWTMLKRITDRVGNGWGDDGNRCGGAKDQHGPWSGPQNRWKTNSTGGAVDVKGLSFREIDPFATFPPEGGGGGGGTPPGEPEPPPTSGTISRDWIINYNLVTFPQNACGVGGDVSGITKFYEVLDNGSSSNLHRDRYRVCMVANGSVSKFIGKKPKRVVALLKKSPTTPAGNVTCVLRRGSDDTIAVTYTWTGGPDLDAAANLTETKAAYTFENLTANYVWQNGDRICIEYSGNSVDTIGDVNVYRNTNNPFDGTASCAVKFDAFSTGSPPPDQYSAADTSRDYAWEIWE
jgi:DNA-binding beta-propeller fold protein YncE